MHFSNSERWPYFSLGPNGLLIDDEGNAPFRTASGIFPAQPRFENAAQAEDWLVAQDIRGSVR